LKSVQSDRIERSDDQKSSKKSPFQSIFDSYLDELFDLARRGDAREESHYPALNNLLNALARAQGRVIEVTVLPKPTEAGNPDFRVWDGSHQVIGYIEAKTSGANLDQVETSEQLQRYLHTFPNLILTDFYEFRLYRDGKLLEHALLARPFVAQQLKAKPPAEQVEELTHLFEAFFSFVLPLSYGRRPGPRTCATHPLPAGPSHPPRIERTSRRPARSVVRLL
jgi:hypothetical protein